MLGGKLYLMGKEFFVNGNNELILAYTPEIGTVKNIYYNFYGVSKKEYFFLNRTYKLSKNNLTSHFKNMFDEYDHDSNNSEFETMDIETVEFVVGRKIDGYLELDKSVFHLTHNCYFDVDINLKNKYFTKDNISIIAAISNAVNMDIYIDSEDRYNGEPQHIPINQYKMLISKMLGSYEIRLYKEKSAQEVARRFFDFNPIAIDRYEKYIGKKYEIKPYREVFSRDYYSSKISEYEQNLTLLKTMLKNEELAEKEWEKSIVDILPLLYPKYLYFINQFEFESLKKVKKPDFLAIDNEGNIDVIEIKKASIGKVVRKYRDNYSPSAEISCACVQIENYIYYLMSNKTVIENQIQEQFSSLLGDLKISIINPQGVLIAGKSDDLTAEEKNDLEVAKRMHKHIYDFVTYDEFINRLENSLKALKGKMAEKLNETSEP